MATTAFGRGARAVDPASLLLGPRPLAAVPALLRLVVVSFFAFGSGAAEKHCATPNLKVATLSERAQARGTHAVRRGSRNPLYSFNSLPH